MENIEPRWKPQNKSQNSNKKKFNTELQICIPRQSYQTPPPPTTDIITSTFQNPRSPIQIVQQLANSSYFQRAKIHFENHLYKI